MSKSTNPRKLNSEAKDQQWYAVYTKSRAEKKVAEELSKAGITNYLPIKRELRQWSDRKKWVEVPAISSYIFVCVNNDEYKNVYQINGVVAYVTDKGKSVTIPEYQIQAMRQTIENKIAFDVEASTITQGKEVTIMAGPLTGIKGIVDKVKDNKKLYLNLDSIGYSIVISLDDVIVE